MSSAPNDNNTVAPRVISIATLLAAQAAGFVGSSLLHGSAFLSSTLTDRILMQIEDADLRYNMFRQIDDAVGADEKLTCAASGWLVQYPNYLFLAPISVAHLLPPVRRLIRQRIVRPVAVRFLHPHIARLKRALLGIGNNSSGQKHQLNSTSNEDATRATSSDDASQQQQNDTAAEIALSSAAVGLAAGVAAWHGCVLSQYLYRQFHAPLAREIVWRVFAAQPETAIAAETPCTIGLVALSVAVVTAWMPDLY